MSSSGSPLRYPGGKAKLFPFFAQLIEKNELFSSTYREPYAGGAGLALKLLFSGYVNSIELNDIDPAIYAFWHSTLHRNDELCALVGETPVNIDEWYKQREIWISPSTHSELELAFATFFLNRTNRSGIIEGAGPIGGYQQAGDLRLDARYYKNTLIARLKEIGRARDKIRVTNIDAYQYLLDNIDTGDLIYLDPPYYVKGKRLYKNFYSHGDHVKIADLVRRSTGKWIVSYDDVPEIRTLYKDCQSLDLRLRYTAAQSSSGKEVVFLSPALHLHLSLLNVA